MKGRQPAVKPGKSGSPIIPGLGADLPARQKARALWQANRFDESVELFEQTAQRHPQNAVALIDAARALGARFEIGRAEPFLERLRLLAKGRPDLLHLVGQTYRMIFRPELAQRCFEQVVARTCDIPDAALELAVLLERRPAPGVSPAHRRTPARPGLAPPPPSRSRMSHRHPPHQLRRFPGMWLSPPPGNCLRNPGGPHRGSRVRWSLHPRRLGGSLL